MKKFIGIANKTIFDYFFQNIKQNSTKYNLLNYWLNNKSRNANKKLELDIDLPMTYLSTPISTPINFPTENKIKIIGKDNENM